MSQVTQARFQTLLKRIFATKGNDPGTRLSEVISPSFDTQDQYQPENRLMRGERTWGVAFAMDNTVGGFRQGQFCNTIGSGKLIVIKRVCISGIVPTVAIQPGRLWAYFSATGGNTTAAVAAVPKDGRVLQLGAVGVLSSGFTSNVQPATTAVAIQLLNFVQELQPAASGTFLMDQEVDVVLSPGSQMLWGLLATALPTGTYNVSSAIQGWERVADPAEFIVPP